MSWQAYVDTSLVGTGSVDRAAIFSAAGDSVWATSPGFTVAPAEIKAIVTAFGGDVSQVMGTGFYLEKQKYMAVRAEGNVIVGKKGKEGACWVKTKQAILVAHHDENALTTNCSNVVESLGQYLMSTGY